MSLRRVSRRFFSQQRPFQLTKGGWVFILYTIGIGAGAINTGNNLLYLVFGIFLGLVLASGVLSDASLWNVAVDWSVPEAAEAGKPCYLPLRITNAKRRFTSLAVTVEMQGELGSATVSLRAFFPSISPGETASRPLVFVPASRGLFQVASIHLRTSYPFGLLTKKWMNIEARAPNREASAFVVYPALTELSAQDLLAALSGSELLSPTDRRGEGSAIHGLRDFRPSDNPRRIHWRASIKRAASELANGPAWVVKEMEEERSEDVLLRWPDLDRFAAMPPSRVEGLIRYAASLVWNYDRRGHRVQLVTREDHRGPFLGIPEASGAAPVRRILEYLSLFDGARPSRPELMAYLEAAPAGAAREAYAIDVESIYEAWKKKNPAAA